MNSTLHFLHIYRLVFHLKKKSYLQTLKRFYGVTTFSRYPLVEIVLYVNQDGIFFLRNLGLWILTIQPSHSYTLAYCRPIHLNSIEFQNIDNDQGSPPKKLFLLFQLLYSCNLYSHWPRFSLQTISILTPKVLWWFQIQNCLKTPLLKSSFSFYFFELFSWSQL
jgi:hypothetical protein